MNNISRYQKYEGMYFRIGVIDESVSGMEWMDENYHFGTFRQTSENLISAAFCTEILVLCLINSPNTTNLLNNIGVFENKENIYESKLLFNSNIDKIIIESNSQKDFTKYLKVITHNVPINKNEILPILEKQFIQVKNLLFEATTIRDNHKISITLSEYVDNNYFDGFEIKFSDTNVFCGVEIIDI